MKDLRKFNLNPDFKTEKLDDEVLLYAVSTGKGVYLNKTAGLVREMCGTGSSVEEIIILLEEAFSEQKNDIRQDVETAVEALLAHGALLRTDEYVAG
jgi:hypothetical protein